MSEQFKPLKAGYAPKAADMPILKQKYQVKYGYYVFSYLIFAVVLTALYIVYDLKKTGFYLEGITLDPTIILIYICGLALVSIGMRLRAGFCVLCGTFRKPTNFDFKQYCDHCGAHLFHYHVFEQQGEEKSKHEMPLNERFMEMVKRGNTDAIRMLLFKGAEVNYQDRFGNTALMNAAMVGNVKVIDLLLQYKADPKVGNNFGLNALMIAVDKSQYEAAKHLLEYGVPIFAVTSDGRDAKEIAMARNDDRMVDLLNQY